MKYAMIVSLLCINNLFAQASNDQGQQLQDFIAKNQSRFEQEIRDEGKAVEQEAKLIVSGLEAMARIVAAFNQKNVTDEEATKLAQQAMEKMQQLMASEEWKKVVNSKASRSAKFDAQRAIINQIDKFRDEQIAKDSAKETQYKAQKAVIHAFMNKFAESAQA